MSLHPSAEGVKANWINYNTSFKYVNFRMKAEKKYSWVGIELTDPDIEIQALFYEQFLENRSYLQSIAEEAWEWKLHVFEDNNKIVSTIGKSLEHVSVFNEDDWPALISFLKPRIIALDEFWSDAKYSFEGLR